MRLVIFPILLILFCLGLGANLWAAPIGFQGNPIQFPYATTPLGPGFQGQFGNPNRFFVDPNLVGPGFEPTQGVFPVNQDPRSRFFDPRINDPRFQPTPMGVTPQRGF
jgi:hypothetical protein